MGYLLRYYWSYLCDAAVCIDQSDSVERYAALLYPVALMSAITFIYLFLLLYFCFFVNSLTLLSDIKHNAKPFHSNKTT